MLLKFFKPNSSVMKKIYLPFIGIIFFSCTPKIHYVGQASPATKKVDVYVTENAIKKNYTLVGQGYLNVLAVHSRPDKIQRLAEQTAMKKGADGIIISDSYFLNGGQSITSTYLSDSLGKGVITTGNTTITPTSSIGFKIFFVKYNP
jgi:hypothetical protein